MIRADVVDPAPLGRRGRGPAPRVQVHMAAGHHARRTGPADPLTGTTGASRIYGTSLDERSPPGRCCARASPPASSSARSSPWWSLPSPAASDLTSSRPQSSWCPQLLLSCLCGAQNGDRALQHPTPPQRRRRPPADQSAVATLRDAGASIAGLVALAYGLGFRRRGSRSRIPSGLRGWAS